MILAALAMIAYSLNYLIIINNNFDKVYDEINIKIEERGAMFIEMLDTGIQEDRAILYTEGAMYNLTKYSNLQDIENDFNILFSYDEITSINNESLYLKTRTIRNKRLSPLCVINYNNNLYVLNVNIFNNPLVSIVELWDLTQYYASIVIGFMILIYVFSWSYKPIEKIAYGLDELVRGNYSIYLREKRSKNTHIERAYKNYNKLVKEIKYNNNSANELVSMISHEIKTPITTIKGYSEMLIKQDGLSEDIKNNLSIINQECTRLAKLTNNMLYLSSIKNKELVEKKSFNLKELIFRVLAMYEYVSVNKDIKIIKDIEELNVFTNEEMLAQVVINILDNAFKFTPSKGKIIIKCAKLNDKVVLSISDNGIGIHQDVIQKIFEPFYSGNKNKTIDSNGLGLTIVKRITELLNIGIEIDSSVNIGTNFTLYL